MRGKYLLFVVAWVAISVGAQPAVLAQGPPETFTYGHIFVSVWEHEPCDEGQQGREAIIEIDPTTGAMSIFADSDDGLCHVSGLRFTPDGHRLLHLNSGHLAPFDGGWVQAFNPDGTSEVILDESDGLARPRGANGLAFDAGGDLYIVNGENSKILRFPAEGGPATIFADFDDGIRGRGALDFAPGGDLFYASDPANTIIRITPNGEASVFDPNAPINIYTMAIDRPGNVFVGVGGGAILRYDNVDPSSSRFLASGFNQGPMALALSPDGSVVYFGEHGGKVFSVDAEDGTTTLLADMSELPFIDVLHAGGLTVYATPPIPTVSQWGIVAMVLLFLIAGMVIVRRRLPTSTCCECSCAVEGSSDFFGRNES